jgi:NAD(P)-dependent dehydrogenase (short-subunit alcohol dehydrogenase family)
MTMQNMLAGKAGVVTGAAGGIGRASAIACAAEGAAVVVSDLPAKEADGQQTVRLIEKAGGTASWAPCDVTRAADQERLVTSAVQRYGRLDFAHNNAGIVVEGRITELAEEDFDRVLAVNLKGVFLGLKYQLRHLAAHGGGAIVNTSSLAGLIAAPEAVAYVASKHGVVGLTKTAAVEWADRNIRVNAICPAATRTPMMLSQPPERQQLLIAPQAMKRYAEPSEIGGVVAWLCSDSASFVTGVAMPVDGGALAW